MTAARPIYVDASIFIFALEDNATYGPACARLLQGIDAAAFAAVTSELTLAEVLTKPMKLGRTDLVARFLAAITGSALVVQPVSRAVLLRSAEIRASHGGRLADTIHIATAVEAGCAMFASEDRGIRPPPGLTRISAADCGAATGTHP